MSTFGSLLHTLTFNTTPRVRTAEMASASADSTPAASKATSKPSVSPVKARREDRSVDGSERGETVWSAPARVANLRRVVEGSETTIRLGAPG